MAKQAKAKPALQQPMHNDQPIIGQDLNQATLAAIKAKQPPAATHKVEQGIDFAKVSASLATETYESFKKRDAAIANVQFTTKKNIGQIWLTYATRYCKSEEDCEAMRKGMMAALALLGDKRANVTASEFKAFALACIVDVAKVKAIVDDKAIIGADVIKAVRAVKNGDETPHKREPNANKKPSERNITNAIRYIGNADLSQLQRLHFACQQRANVLRARGEVFGFLTDAATASGPLAKPSKAA